MLFPLSDLVLPGNSLVVQWLGLHAFTAGGLGSTPGQGAKILQAVQPKKKKKKIWPCRVIVRTRWSARCLSSWAMVVITGGKPGPPPPSVCSWV